MKFITGSGGAMRDAMSGAARSTVWTGRSGWDRPRAHTTETGSRLALCLICGVLALGIGAYGCGSNGYDSGHVGSLGPSSVSAGPDGVEVGVVAARGW